MCTPQSVNDLVAQEATTLAIQQLHAAQQNGTLARPATTTPAPTPTPTPSQPPGTTTTPAPAQAPRSREYVPPRLRGDQPLSERQIADRERVSQEFTENTRIREKEREALIERNRPYIEQFKEARDSGITHSASASNHPEFKGLDVDMFIRGVDPTSLSFGEGAKGGVIFRMQIKGTRPCIVLGSMDGHINIFHVGPTGGGNFTPFTAEKSG